MGPQMGLQRNIFQETDYPVTMLQGQLDKGQPASLFDGTAHMKIVEEPVGNSIKERIVRHNITHKVITTYSNDANDDGDRPIVIGPTAEDFFPNR